MPNRFRTMFHGRHCGIVECGSVNAEVGHYTARKDRRDNGHTDEPVRCHKVRSSLLVREMKQSHRPRLPKLQTKERTARSVVSSADRFETHKMTIPLTHARTSGLLLNSSCATTMTVCEMRPGLQRRTTDEISDLRSRVSVSFTYADSVQRRYAEKRLRQYCARRLLGNHSHPIGKAIELVVDRLVKAELKQITK